MREHPVPIIAAATIGIGIVCGSTWAHADPSELPAQLGYGYGEIETPRSAGMAAAHALGSGLTAPFLNPANMGLTRAYHIGAVGQFIPEAGRQAYGGGIIDSTRRLSGAVCLAGAFQDPDGIDRSQLDVRLALAYAITPSVHLGMAGRYVNVDQDGLGPLGVSRASGGLVDPDDPPLGRSGLLTTVTFDAGFTLRPIDELAIAAFGQNLTYPNHGLLPTLVGGGVGYGTDDFSIEVDGLADLSSYEKVSARLMAGGEYLIVDRVPLRLGYRFDAMSGSGFAPSHALSGGLGYVDPRFGVEMSVRRTVAGPQATTIVVGLTYFLDSLGLQVGE